VTGTALVASDGHKSVTRQVLLGAEKAASLLAPYVATRVLIKFKDPEDAIRTRSIHPINSVAIHPNGIWAFTASKEHHRYDRPGLILLANNYIVLDVVDPNGPTSWTFQLTTS
jgi:hypothetical protein